MFVELNMIKLNRQINVHWMIISQMWFVHIKRGFINVKNFKEGRELSTSAAAHLFLGIFFPLPIAPTPRPSAVNEIFDVGSSGRFDHCHLGSRLVTQDWFNSWIFRLWISVSRFWFLILLGWWGCECSLSLKLMATW